MRCLYCGLTCSVCSVLLLVPSVSVLALITTCEHNPTKGALLVPMASHEYSTVSSCGGHAWRQPCFSAGFTCCETAAKSPM